MSTSFGNESTEVLADVAARALACMRQQGFDHAQVSASRTRLDELNVAHNEPSLLRSTHTHKLGLTGLVDGRMASTDVSDLADDAVQASVRALFADALSAPRDDANAVSAGQHARIVRGPQESDRDLLAGTMADLLRFRESETPNMMIDEGAASHTLQQVHTLTSGGSDLGFSLGWYGLGAFGTAREGDKSSSFNYADGVCLDLAGEHAPDRFGIGDMLRDTERQIHTEPVPGKFTGEVVFTPNAVAALLNWLLGQIGDTQLIAGTSLYSQRVGQRIASPLLDMRSRFDAPGVVPASADAFLVPPVEVLRAGTLLTLAPSFYGSRKTGLAHVPTASAGWELGAGATPRAQLIAGMARGAVVGRLSMGSPAPNGDFSAVIKNSFTVADGVVGPALSEAMIAGNIARLLHDVVAVSRERIDTGTLCLPWLRMSGLHFS